MRSKATVAAGHPLVVEAAIEILRQGGNAFDAVVAGGFAACVAEPLLTGLGGGGFLLARTETGREVLYDFFVDTPGRGLGGAILEPHFFPVTVQFAGSTQDFNIGLGSAAVPGTLRGFLHVHEQLGRLPLATIVAPATALARQGIVVNHHQAYVFALLRPIVTISRAGRALFAPKGDVPTAGELFTNPPLADFLEGLAAHPEKTFYCGDLAGRIDADMEAGLGLLTAEDLAAYRVIERQPLAINYRGRRLLTNPPPSFGGSLIAVMLRLLDEFPLCGYDWGSSSHLLTLAGVMAEVDRQRAGSGNFDAAWHKQAAGRVRLFSRGTTHISVADAAGNVAAMTASNGEGSGYLIPGTGIMLNNMMGEDDLHPEGFHASPPGKRVASMMAPTLVEREGWPELVLGSGGSKRIRSAIVQVISNLIDFGLDVENAVRAPRLHWDGSVLQLEPGFASEAIKALRRLWPVNIWEEKEIYFGGVHAVTADGQGAGDPRRGGAAASLRNDSL